MWDPVNAGSRTLSSTRFYPHVTQSGADPRTEGIMVGVVLLFQLRGRRRRSA
ncbi:hypothetical protein [Streptomyces sp. AS58]|uniref:hypothetical protein n=1 Tax=Streptomyces sp. AS58 TaxID=1519489 RepID=UPI00131CE774|nr:hypothetical protein [Streptomyces sp. AS58]